MVNEMAGWLRGSRAAPVLAPRKDRPAPNQCHPTELVDTSHLWPNNQTSIAELRLAGSLLDSSSVQHFRSHVRISSPDFACCPASTSRESRPAFWRQGSLATACAVAPMAPQPLHSLTLSPPLTGHAVCKCSTVPLFGKRLPLVVAFPRAVASCSAVQESSTATTVSEKKEADGDTKEATAEAKPAAKPAAKPKKAPSKPLPEMMQDEVIPPLKAALEAEDVSQVELSFQDNRLEGSFIKDEITYYFWAFFPKGDLTGPKGFSMSSYGTEVSTIEPFLIDEKRITPKLVVFWVHKRLAGQGILPVWKEEEGEGEGAE